LRRKGREFSVELVCRSREDFLKVDVVGREKKKKDTSNTEEVAAKEVKNLSRMKGLKLRKGYAVGKKAGKNARSRKMQQIEGGKRGIGLKAKTCL